MDTKIQECNGVFTLTSADYRLCCAIDTTDGFNMIRLCYEGTEYIVVDENRRRNNATYGIPILFPTPNIVRADGFTFDHVHVPAKMHGIVRQSAFHNIRTIETDESVTLTGEVVFGKECEMFPYDATLELSIIVAHNCVTWNYAVTNQDKRRLGYSFALHPFFARRPGVRFEADVVGVMQVAEDRFPTGKIEPICKSETDIRYLTDPETVYLNHVYCVGDSRTSMLHYPDTAIKIKLKASAPFDRLVVFTPPENFLCLENQTSSVDCHNLYEKGYSEAANLQIVEPGKRDGGSVCFYFLKA